MGFYNKLTPEQQHKLHFWGWMLLGNIIFAVGVNVIITPVNLYNGGFMGMAQLLRLLYLNVLHLPVPKGTDIVGVIYFILNVPLFVVSYKVVGRDFCIKSIVSIGIGSLALALIPVPSKALFDDILTSCIVGGIVAGSGAGMVLRSGSSGGGQDIIGVIGSMLNPNFSVGQISIMINIGVYVICLFIFDLETVIYSLIYTTILAMFLDRMHVQNINVEAMIFTKKLGVSDAILTQLKRGVTNWDGRGAYTHEESYILVTIISKYEVDRLINIVHSIDPNAFVIVTEGAHVYGNFQKRLTE